MTCGDSNGGAGRALGDGCEPADQPAQPLERSEHDGAQDDGAVRGPLAYELHVRHAMSLAGEPEREIKCERVTAWASTATTWFRG